MADLRTLWVSLFNCPHAAIMSSPRGRRIGLAYPALLTISPKASIRFQSDRSYPEPGYGLKGIKFILAGIPEIKSTRRLASSSESLIFFSITYSKVIRSELESFG